MNKNQKKILSFLSKQDASKFISQKTISEKTGISSTLVGTECYKLREAEYLEPGLARLGMPLDYRITIKGEEQLEKYPQKPKYPTKIILGIISIIVTIVTGGTIAITGNVGDNIINNSPDSEINIGQDIDIDNEGTIIINPAAENNLELKSIIPHHEIWQTYRDNRPYTLGWSTCSFSTQTSVDGEISWDFSMKPIMINKENQSSLIPFNISYRFSYDGLVENDWRSLRTTSSENSQKTEVDPKEIGIIHFSQITTALREAESEGITQVRIMKDKTAFNPYSPELDDNLQDSYIYDREDKVVTIFKYNIETNEWDDFPSPDSICNNRFEE